MGIRTLVLRAWQSSSCCLQQPAISLLESHGTKLPRREGACIEAHTIRTLLDISGHGVAVNNDLFEHATICEEFLSDPT